MKMLYTLELAQCWRHFMQYSYQNPNCANGLTCKGYKNWIEQAVAESDDPEGTRQRIEDYTNKNRLKGTAIMILFSAVWLASSAMNPYVPPTN